MSIAADYIICECGDDFSNEEELGIHLQNNHQKKRPVAESDWEEDFSEEESEAEIKTEVHDEPDTDSKDFEERNDSADESCPVAAVPNFPEHERVITIKAEPNQHIEPLNFDNLVHEMVLSHEEVIDQKESNLVTLMLAELPLSVKTEPDLFPSEEILRDQLNEEDDKHEIDPRICELCQRVFPNQRSFAVHCSKAHNVPATKPKKPRHNFKDRICEVCGKGFASNAALRYHQRVHTGERPYHCAVCGKRFAMPLLLQIHMRIHTGERPYQCQLCPKAFTNKAAINRHNRVHTGVKPYPCPECGKAFTQSNSMKLHVRTVHLKQPAPYKSKKRIQAQLEKMQSYGRRVQNYDEREIKYKDKVKKMSVKFVKQQPKLKKYEYEFDN